MSLKLDTHLFGSRTGYQCLAKSAAVSSAEDRLLSEFGFGQSSDDRFLRGLVTSPTAFARPLSGGRIAITRVLAGPLDDGGRPTLERRSILLSAREYLSVRRELGQLLSNSRIWSATEFSSGQPISVEAPRAGSRSAQEGDWLVFDAWVSALDRPPHAVVVGSGDDASDAILSAVACLADEDALRFSWGIRLLSPIAWVDVISLSPYGSMDGRRQVFGLSRSGCVNPAVSAARASHPDRLPSLAALRPVEVHAPEVRSGRRGDRAGRRPDARPARARARTRVVVAVSAVSALLLSVIVGIVLARGNGSRGPGPMLGSRVGGSGEQMSTQPADSPARASGTVPEPQPEPAPDPAPVSEPDSAPAAVTGPDPSALPGSEPVPVPAPPAAPTPAPQTPPSPPPPPPPPPSEPLEPASVVLEVNLTDQAQADLKSLVEWANQLVDRDLRILALYEPASTDGSSVGLLELLREYKKGPNMRGIAPPKDSADPRTKKDYEDKRWAYENRLTLIRDRCNDIIGLGSSSDRVAVPVGVEVEGYVQSRLAALRTRMADLSPGCDCGVRSALAPLVLESAMLLSLARQFTWDKAFFDSEAPGKQFSNLRNLLAPVEMLAFDISEKDWFTSPRCQTVLAGRIDSLRPLPAAGFQWQTTSIFLKNDVTKLLPRDAVKALGAPDRRTVSGYLEAAMKHVIGDCATSEQLRNAWAEVRSFVERTEPAKP